ncbi:MAG: metal-dependent transcriptional regulator [Candidatus Kapaibacterium sp.]
MLSQAVQDYLKTIYKLEENGPVSTTKIAKELNISGASVTGMLKRLSTMGMVDYNSYKGVRLTGEGKKIALEIIRHHRLLELYLKEMLGFSLEKVHDEACRLEHAISDEFVDKIDKLLGKPQYDPHGHPIPNKEGRLPEHNEKKLLDIDPGKEVIIKRLSDEDPEMLAYFEKMGLIPNVNVIVIDKAPFNGPITINYNKQNKIIGHEIAGNIYVEPVKETQDAE